MRICDDDLHFFSLRELNGIFNGTLFFGADEDRSRTIYDGKHGFQVQIHLEIRAPGSLRLGVAAGILKELAQLFELLTVLLLNLRKWPGWRPEEGAQPRRRGSNRRKYHVKHGATLEHHLFPGPTFQVH